MTKSNERWWAIAGPVFTVLFYVVVFTLEPDSPGEKASGEEVVNYFDDRQGQALADVFLAPLLVALLLVFVSYLRARVRDLERGPTARVGSTMLILGAAVWASGALLGSVAQLSLASAADNGKIAAAETLNVLSNTLWLPFIAGVAVTLVGAGLSVLSTDVLPRWLGWVALVAGVISLAGPGGFLGFFVGPLWVLVAGVFLFLRPQGDVPVPRARTGATSTATPAAAAEPTATT